MRPFHPLRKNLLFLKILFKFIRKIKRHEKMNVYPLLQRINFFVFWIANGLTCTIGLISVLGWIIGYPALFQPFKNLPPIQFDAALGITCLSLSIMISYQRKNVFSTVFGASAIAISLWALLGYIQITKYSINLLPNVDVQGAKDYMALSLAIPLAIGGIVNISVSEKNDLKWFLFCGACGIIIVSLGFYTLISFFVPSSITFAIDHTTPLALQDAFCLNLIGIGLLAQIYKIAAAKNIDLNKWSPALFTTMLMLVNIFIFAGLKIKYQSISEKRLNIEAKIIDHHIEEHVKNIANFLHLIRDAYEMNQLNKALMLREAKTFMAAQDYLESFLWMNANRQLTALAGKSAEDGEIPLDLSKELGELLKNNSHGNIEMVYLDSSKIRTPKLLIYSYLFKDGAFDAAPLIVIDPQVFFHHILASSNGDSYQLTVQFQGKSIFKTETPTKRTKTISKSINLRDIATLDIQVFQSTKNAPSYYIYFIRLIFISGILFSFSFGMIIFFWLRNFEQLEKIDNTKKQMDIALSCANMGTWRFDPRQDQLFWDNHTSQILGLKPAPYFGELTGFFLRMPLEEHDRFREEIKESLRKEEMIAFDHSVIWPDHTTHKISFRATSSNGIISGVVWDVTKAKQTEDILYLDNEITDILKKTNDFFENTQAILQAICHHLDWDIALFWSLNSEQNRLSCIDLFAKVPSSSLVKSAQNPVDQKGGLAEQTYQKNSVQIIENLSDHTHLHLVEEALSDNMRSAISFPICDDKQFFGVIELYGKYFLKGGISKELQNYLLDLGTSLSHFQRERIAEYQKEQLAAIVESSHEAIIRKDLEGKILSWNDGAQEIFQFEASEMIGQNIHKIVPDEKNEEIDQILREIKQGNSTKHLETTRLAKNGARISVLITVSPIKENKKIVGSGSIIQNIQKIKETEQGLRESEKKFRSFVETTNDWVWRVDERGSINYTNPSIKLILGYEPEEMLTNHLSLFVFSEDRKSFEQTFDNCSTHNKGWTNQTLRWIHKNGSIIWLESNAEAVIDENNRFKGIQGVDRDITERKKLEKMKNEFVSMVSHELRTPLTSIQGSIGLILGKMRETISEKTSKLLTIADNNCKRLINLINDILDVEKIESGKFTLDLSPIDLIEVIHYTIQSLESFAAKYEVHIEKKAMPEKAVIHGDKNRMIQVMTNLLSNAIKFSDAGKAVTIDIVENNDSYTLSVSDQGYGIPENFKPNIFNKFERADNSTTRKKSGTGLGLPISKSIIEQHGGKLEFTSEENKGSTFSFTLSKYHEQKNQKSETSEMQPISLLLLAENQELLEFIKNTLGDVNLALQRVESAEEAKKNLEKNTYQALILDIDVISEEDFLLLKKFINTNLPLIIVAKDIVQQKENYKAFPILACIAKPIDPKLIVAKVREIKSKLFKRIPRILYLEDDHDLASTVSSILKKENTEIIIASTLKEAQEKISKEPFDLVLLDLLLPDGRGEELLPYINIETKLPIPVIIFSVKEKFVSKNQIKAHLLKSQASNEELVFTIKSIIMGDNDDEKNNHNG